MEKPLVICTTLLIETSPQALPLGAACIASAIKNDIKTKDLFNIILFSISKEDKGYKLCNQTDFICNEILKYGIPKFLCLSVYVWNREELEKASKQIKERYPQIIVIAGGPEVTANPLSFDSFDYCTVGQGEFVVPNLIYELENKNFEPESILKGVFSNKKSLKIQNNEIQTFRAASPNLDTLSSPYLDGTLDPSKYGGALWELARGCPFKCSYCYESKGEKQIQYFSLERIEKELDLFNKLKINQIFVLDPTYNANKKRALDLLKLIEKKAPGIFFYFEARAEFIDKELAKAFTKIPCSLQFGLQSSNPEVLKYVNRNFDKKIFTKNIGFLNKEGVTFGFDLIYGLPKDNLNGFIESIDFALSLYPNNLETFCLSVLPGTTLFESASSLGLVYEKEPPYHVIKSSSFSEKDLKRAKELSNACNIIYNQGRAVPWFLSICKALKMKPTELLDEFIFWFKNNLKDDTLDNYDNSCHKHIEIESIQLDFIKYILSRKQKIYFTKTIESIILFNGALSRVESDGTSQNVKLCFHPDDLASPYVSDIPYFSKACKQFKCIVNFFSSKNGIDWKVIK